MSAYEGSKWSDLCSNSSANFTNNLADLGSFHSDRLLAHQLCKSPEVKLWHTISNPASIDLHLREIDCLVQTFSFVGKVRARENTAGADDHEEEVYAFGQKTRSHEKDSSPVESHGVIMAYTRVRTDDGNDARGIVSACAR